MRRTSAHCAWFFALALLASAPAAAADGDTGSGQRISLQEALFRGLERNFDLQAERLNISIGSEDVIVAESRFDPVAEALASAGGEKIPEAVVPFDEAYSRRRQYAATTALNKEFHTGLDSRLAMRAVRQSNDAAAIGLDPEYRTFLVLDFTQPLLRDFGTDVNTADLRIAGQRLQQARFGYLDQAQRLVEAIELAYLELARAHEILRLRIESRNLASELLEGNRNKFEAGIVPITEVQEAETAVAARDEQVVFSRQQLETAAYLLKNLLEIGHDDPLAGELLIAEALPGIEPDWPQLTTAMATALAERPDLEQLKLEIINRDIRLAYYQNQQLPRLDLDASFGVNGLSGDLTDGPGSGTRANSGDYWDSLDQAASGDGYTWFVGLRFEYPLGNRAAEARYRRAGHEKRRALYSLKSLENTVETEVRNALSTVERVYERIQVAERFQRLADITLNQEMERLQEGLTDTFRILEFQAAVIESRVRKANAQIDFHQGIASLYRAMGANLERHGIVNVQENKEPHNAKN